MSLSPRPQTLLFSMIVLASAGLIGAASAEPRLDAEYAEVTRELSLAKDRVRVLTERLRQLEHRRSQDVRMLANSSGYPRDCSTPFRLDPQGVKHLRPECAGTSASVSCTTPFTIDGDGIKRVRTACGPEANGNSASQR